MAHLNTSERVEWVDAAKAVSIILVVLYHARHLTYLLGWEELQSARLAWETVSAVLKPIRMPFFFLISGMLASSSLTRDWDDVSRKRVYRLYYVYAVWAGVFALLIPAFPSAAWSPQAVSVRLISAAAGLSLAWYIWALASFFAIGWITRGLPTALLLSIGIAAAFSAPLLDGVIVAEHISMLRCLPFFLLGLRLPLVPSAIAEIASRPRLVAALLAFCAAISTLNALGELFAPVVDAVAVVASIMCIKVATDSFSVIKIFGASFAKFTLPIYLLHFPLLVAILSVSRQVLTEDVLDLEPVALSFPIIATAVSILGSLLIYRCAERYGVNWLFDLPCLPVNSKLGASV